MARELRPLQLKISTGTTDNDTVTTKGYVDEHSSNNIWTRTGTEITVTNSGDNIDFSTAGLLESSTFDSSNIAIYDAHPTFTADTDIVDKKYVDDKLGLIGQKDVLPVTTPGQTAFTLTTTPTNTSTMVAHVRGIFYDYGFGFTVSGTALTWLDPEGITLDTTDRFVVIYDHDIAASPFTQYWQRIGTTLSPLTAGDNIELTTGGYIKKDTISGAVSSIYGINLFTEVSYDKTTLYMQADLASDEASHVTFAKGRGTHASPSAVQTNDNLGILQFKGHNGSTYADGAEFRIIANETFGSGLGTRYEWWLCKDTTSSLVELMQLDGTGLTVSGALGLNSGTTTNEISTTVDSGSTDDQLCTAKAAYDAIAGENIWDRTGTTITVANAGDDIDFSTAGLIQSGSFDSANISSYNTHPTFTSDTQIVDKKYVDDQAGAVVAKQETLVVSSPGQTAFTLAQTPSGTDSFGLYLNGQLREETTDYTFTGTSLTWNDPGGLTLKTTDQLIAWYDWQAPSIGSLDQLQIYYVGKAGSDSNDGKSIEKPFLNANHAFNTVSAQTPSSSNQFAIKFIGGGNWADGSATIPAYTFVDMTDAIFSGTVIAVGIESAVHIGELRGVASLSNIIISGSGNRHLKIDTISGATNSIALSSFNGATVYFDVDDTSTNATGSRCYSANTGSVIFLNARRFKENTASTNDGTASIFKNIQDKGSNADTEIINSTGDIIIEANSSAQKDVKITATKDFSLTTSGSVIFETDQIYPKWATLPLFRARVTSENTDATGDGTVHTINFQTTDFDQGNHFSTSTNQFTAPITGKYIFIAKLFIGDLTSSHTEGILQVHTTSQTYSIFDVNIANLRTPSNAFAYTSSGALFDLTLGETAELRIAIYNGSKVVDVQTLTSFEGYLISAT